MVSSKKQGITSPMSLEKRGSVRGDHFNVRESKMPWRHNALLNQICAACQLPANPIQLHVNHLPLGRHIEITHSGYMLLLLQNRTLTPGCLRPGASSCFRMYVG